MKILIADDHQLLADALAQLVRDNEEDSKVLQASSFEDAMKTMKREDKVEIVLLDYDLPGMDGFNGLDKFTGKFPKTPCAIFSGNPDAEVATDALSRGAAGIIPKSLSAPAFFHAIKLIQVGEKFIPSELYEDMAAQSQKTRQEGLSAASFVKKTGLSRRETEVLQALVQGISNKLIGDQLGVEEVTIKLHLRRVYKKIKVANRTQAVKLAMANGLG